MLKKNSSPHLVLFDVDGTLADTHDVASKAYLHSAKKHFSLDAVDLDWGKYTSSTATGIAREIAQNKWNRLPFDKEIEGIKEDVLNAVEKARIDAIPGSIELIEHLIESEDYAVGIATGNFHCVALHTLNKMGLTKDIPLATADEHTDRSGIITLAAEKTLKHANVASFRAITYVGDGAWDYRAAHSLGHDFIGIGPCPKMSAIVGERRVSDFTDIDKITDLLRNIIIE